MEPGKQKCKILKQIRKQIADANDIRYVVDECPHKGDCAGTCPKCEAEVRYLETQLAERRRLGKAVAIVGLAAGLAAVASVTSSCFRHNGDLKPYQLEGDVACPADSDSFNINQNEVVPADATDAATTTNAATTNAATTTNDATATNDATTTNDATATNDATTTNDDATNAAATKK